MKFVANLWKDNKKNIVDKFKNNLEDIKNIELNLLKKQKELKHLSNYNIMH